MARRNNTTTHSRASAPQSPRRSSTGGFWRWLGLGALGLIAAWIFGKTPRRPDRPRPDLLPQAEPEAISLDPPDDLVESWIAGPAGSLRLLERHPEGETAVVYVHGLGGKAELWAAQLGALGPGLRGIALDLPGHGGSDAPAEATIALHGAAIGAALDALGLRRAVVVAHSLGAFAALDYAASHPGRVAGLFLIDPSGDQSGASAVARERMLAPLRREARKELEWSFGQMASGATSEVRERVMAALGEADTETRVGTFEAGVTYAPLDALRRYEGPVWAVLSDFNTLPTSLHHLDSRIEARHLRDTSHWLMMDRPSKTQEIFWDFLDLLSREKSH